MCNFTKIQRKQFVLLEREILSHLHLIFDTCIISTKLKLTKLIPDSKNNFDVLIFQMEEKFSYLMAKAFQFGIEHSALDLNAVIQKFSTLPPAEILAQNAEYTERIQKTVNILSGQNRLFNKERPELFNQFLDLLKKAYSLEPYSEQIIQVGMEIPKATLPLSKAHVDRIKPPFSLRQLECLILAAQGNSRSQIAKILRISYGQVVGAFDCGSVKIRLTVDDITEYNTQEIIKALAQKCNMTERSMEKCIELIVAATMDLPEIRAYMQPLTVDEVLRLLYQYFSTN